MSTLVNLYRVTAGPTVWRFHSGRARQLVVASQTYIGKVIKRGRFSRDFGDDRFDIETVWDHEPWSYFRNGSSGVTVNVDVLSSTATLLFRGRVVSVEAHKTDRRMKISLASLSQVAKGEVPGHWQSPECPYELFGGLCQVVRSLHQVIVPTSEVVISASGLEVTHSAFATKPDGYFTLGYLEAGFERALITRHVGSTLYLYNRFFQSFPTTMAAYAGCDKKRATCRTKFANVARFGGYPFVPITNPVTDGF
jgi:hypothetical protein